MRRVRVIPVLLLKKDALVKSVQFKNYKYIGDPFNAVRIFNEKEVDELAIIDITATRESRKPDIQKVKDIAGEAFMPLSYGGGITHIDEVKDILFNGIEKVIINKASHTHKDLITQIAQRFGSQSVVASIDIKKNLLGKYKVFTDNGSFNTGKDPVDWAKECEAKGAGEILLNFIKKDGTYKGYDVKILRDVASSVSIPVIACGGAAGIADFKQAIQEGHASAVAAGSMFVFQRPHNAVLISYPSPAVLNEQLYMQL